MNGRYSSDGSYGGMLCANCGKPKGEHAAITSAINDEHWCPKGDGTFRENNCNIGANIYRPGSRPDTRPKPPPSLELQEAVRKLWPSNLTDMSDDEINRRKFTVMQRICDEKGLPYHPSLVAWLARQEKQ